MTPVGESSGTCVGTSEVFGALASSVARGSGSKGILYALNLVSVPVVTAKTPTIRAIAVMLIANENFFLTL